MTLRRMFCAVVVALGVAQSGAASETAVTLEEGYRLMYGLDFASAERVFLEWRAEYPRDPLGPTSLAANLLFAELYRSGVMQAQFLVDDKSFTASKPSPPPGLRARFDAAVGEAEAVARTRLGEDPHDRDALFALAMAFGLRADFAALIEGRNMAALSYTREASHVARTLIALAPDYADAYLATGIGRYIVGSLFAPMRWFLGAAGFEGGKNEGMRELRLAAVGGRFLGPFARIMLATACLREHDRNGACELLAGLARDFPSNPLFARELQRLGVKSN
jgi:hypothetical protein